MIKLALLSLTLLLAAPAPISVIASNQPKLAGGEEVTIETSGVYDDLKLLFQRQYGREGVPFNPHTITPVYGSTDWEHADFKVMAVYPHNNDMFVYYWAGMQSYLKNTGLSVPAVDWFESPEIEYFNTTNIIQNESETEGIKINPILVNTHGTDLSKFYKVKIENVNDMNNGADAYRFKLKNFKFNCGKDYEIPMDEYIKITLQNAMADALNHMPGINIPHLGIPEEIDWDGILWRNADDEIVYDYSSQNRLLFEYTAPEYVQILDKKVGTLFQPLGVGGSGWGNVVGDAAGGILNPIGGLIGFLVGDGDDKQYDKLSESHWTFFKADRQMDKLLEVTVSYEMLSFDHYDKNAEKTYVNSYSPRPDCYRGLYKPGDSTFSNVSSLSYTKTITPERVSWSKEFNDGSPLFKTTVSADYDNIIKLNSIQDYTMDSATKEFVGIAGRNMDWGFEITTSERTAEARDYATAALWPSAWYRSETHGNQINYVTILRLKFLENGVIRDLEALDTPTNSTITHLSDKTAITRFDVDALRDALNMAFNPFAQLQFLLGDAFVPVMIAAGIILLIVAAGVIMYYARMFGIGGGMGGGGSKVIINNSDDGYHAKPKTSSGGSTTKTSSKKPSAISTKKPKK